MNDKSKVLSRISPKVHKAITEEARTWRSVDEFLWMLISNWKVSKQKEDEK